MIQIRYAEFENYCREQLGLSQHSIRAYQQDLKSFHNYAVATSIEPWPTGEQIVGYQRHLREVKASSPSTIRRRIVTLRSYFRWLCESEQDRKSPFEGLRLELKIPQRLPRPIDRPTLGALFRSSRHLIELDVERTAKAATRFTSQHVNGLVARLLVVTGMRIGEITGLLVGDVSGAGSQIRVRGKGARERTVYVTNRRLLDDFRIYWEARYRNSGPTGPVFLNSRGTRLSEAAFRKRLRAISKSLLIEPHLTPHRFRHSAATLLVEEGVDIRIVQRLLGHASISTTELYTKVSDNSLVAAVERADTLGQVDR